MNRLLPGFFLAIFLAAVAASAISWCEWNNSAVAQITPIDSVGSGLMIGEKSGLNPAKEAAADVKLKWISIAGEDKKFQWANAIIDGQTLVVSCDQVPNPVAVRYNFTMNPQGANLYNKEGFPASPFRTDSW